MAFISSISVQSIVDWARSFTKLIPIIGVGGINNEPALSIANNVMQEILSPPYNWKWNRNELAAFDTISQNATVAVQDQIVTGASASVRNVPGVGGVAIETTANSGATQASTTVTITTVAPHNFATGQSVIVAGVVVAGYNGTFTITGTPTSTTFTYTTGSGLAVSGAPGVSNMGWLESCTLEGSNETNVPKPTVHIDAVQMIQRESEIGNPEEVCWLPVAGKSDRITVRFSPVPGNYQWTCYLIYQATPPILSDLTNTIAPLPDDYAYIFRQGFLAAALLHADDQRAQSEYQKFQLLMQKALGRADAEDNAESFYPQRSLMMGG